MILVSFKEGGVHFTVNNIKKQAVSHLIFRLKKNRVMIKIIYTFIYISPLKKCCQPMGLFMVVVMLKYI